MKAFIRVYSCEFVVEKKFASIRGLKDLHGHTGGDFSG
jgi:hypothetical protein